MSRKQIKSKRIKINFETINKGNYTVIPQNEINETNNRIKKAMKDKFKGRNL